MERMPIQKLEELLNQRQICQGSRVRITEMSENKVVVRLEGTCAGCPGVRITLEDVIEAAVKELIPSINEVVLDSSCDEEMLALAKRLMGHRQAVN